MNVKQSDKVVSLVTVPGRNVYPGDRATVAFIDPDPEAYPCNHAVRFPSESGGTQIVWMRAHEVRRADAPKVLADGVSSDQLAGYVEEFINACKSRVLGVGKDQYENDGRQGFEDMSPVELIREARAEAQDGAVYMAMLDIQLARLENRLITQLGKEGMSL